MMKKISAGIIKILTFTVAILLLSGCSYFYPTDGRYHDVEPSLIQQKEIELNYHTIKKGDIFEGYEIGADAENYCIYVNDPLKTTIAKADIDFAEIKNVYVKQNDYVEEGDILIEYLYEMDKDTAFKYDLAKRRAELRYENAYMQYMQGKITKETLDGFHKSYVTAKDNLDKFYANEEKYTLRAPCSGYIAKIVGDIVTTSFKRNIAFHICNIKDGLILLYASEDNEIAAYPFLIFSEGAKAELYDEETDTEYKATVDMSNMSFNKIYSEYLDSFYGSGILYMTLELEDNKLPENIKFNQRFSASLIKKQAKDILLVPTFLVETENTANSAEPFNYYVYRISSDEVLERVYIEIGETFDNFYEVKDGLTEGDMVLIR